MGTGWEGIGYGVGTAYGVGRARDRVWGGNG